MESASNYGEYDIHRIVETDTEGSYDTDETFGAMQDDDVYSRGAEAAELAGNSEVQAPSLWAYYQEIGVNRDEYAELIRLEYADPLLFAEELDIDMLRERAVLLKNPHSIGHQMEAASNLAELALATLDEAEADEAFAISETLNRSVLTRASPRTDFWYRASLAVDYVPILRMRRADAPQGDMSEAAQQALGKSLKLLGPRAMPFAYGASPDSTITGVLSEHAVAGLVARTGHAPFFSSGREGQGVSTGVSRASDFHLIEGEKLPVEVKYRIAPSRSRVDARVAIVKYSRVCREAGHAVYGKDAPTSKALSFIVSQALAHEAEGGTLPDHQRQLLNEASHAVEALIDAKRRS